MQNSWTYTADLVRFADLERGAQHRRERRSCFERLVSGSSPTYFRLQQERRCALHKCRNWAGSRPQRSAQKGKVICCNGKCPLLQREVSRYTATPLQPLQSLERPGSGRWVKEISWTRFAYLQKVKKVALTPIISASLQKFAAIFDPLCKFIATL